MEGSIRKSPGFSRFGIYRKQGGKSAKRWALNGGVNTLWYLVSSKSLVINGLFADLLCWRNPLIPTGIHGTRRRAYRRKSSLITDKFR
jgi:hypothetical protein